MHKYLRAVGFSKVKNSKDMHEVIMNILENADHRDYISGGSDDTLLAEFKKEYAEHIGVVVCGEFDEDDKFSFEYCYPYLTGENITSMEDITIEPHADKESYAGVCDEPKVGVSLVFYLQNRIPYIRLREGGQLPVRGTTLNLSGLSIQGMILLPIQKNEEEMEKAQKQVQNRTKLIAQARAGNENAIETLTLEDMDTYNTISKRIRREDVMSLVDTYFMPYGVECDQYSILGEIKDCHLEVNRVTNEEIYVMTIESNELTFDICINKIDLYGEPAVGRRFKGVVWLQGFVNYP